MVRMTDGVCVDDELTAYRQFLLESKESATERSTQEFSILLRKRAMLQAVADTGRVSGLRDTASKDRGIF